VIHGPMNRMNGQSISTIVAVSTARGRGGLGVVRLSGPRALEIARQMFITSETLGTPRSVRYGRFIDHTTQPIDTGLAWFLPGPRSYTGEDTVELSAHGSEIVLELIVQSAIGHGAVAAEPGEFTRRAFLNGRIDLLQAEAVLDVIEAGSRGEILQAYGAASGRLSKEIVSLRERMVAAMVQVEAGIDFAEEDIDSASSQAVLMRLGECAVSMRSLIEGFDGARRRQDGWMVLLTGPPNVGKSTLLNALAHEERAIVSPTPGTTRDWVDARVVWDGELIRLVDTAGLRTSEELVEREGVRRTVSLTEEADVVVLVIDGSQEWPQELEGSVACEAAHVVARNKVDLGTRACTADLEGVCVLDVSAKTGDGLRELQDAMVAALPVRDREDVAIVRERHRELLSASLVALERAMGVMCDEPEKAAADLQDALRHVGELLGEDVSEAVLDGIFREFCIGK
jgi:tRNA modification GTPase